MDANGWLDVTLNFLRSEEGYEVFNIEFDNEWKEIKFRTLPGTILEGIYYSDYCVYVSIPESSDQRGNGPYYENKVWPAMLQLKLIGNRIFLQRHYTVLGKFATVVSWIDSERGKGLQAYIARGNGSASSNIF